MEVAEESRLGLVVWEEFFIAPAGSYSFRGVLMPLHVLIHSAVQAAPRGLMLLCACIAAERK